MMRICTPKALVIVLFILGSSSLFSQSNFWTEARVSDYRSPLKERATNPSDFRTVELNKEAFLDLANTSKQRFADDTGVSPVMYFPLPNGENGAFAIERAELMHPDLEATFPELKTFVGKA